MKLMKIIAISSLLFTINSMAEEDFVKEITLNMHNQERKLLDIEPLKWSDELAKGAQDWAINLSLTSKVKRGKSGHGENIWSGPENSITIEEMMYSWLEQKKDFNANKKVPKSCNTKWKMCEKYSQMVWSKTTHMGCALVSSQESDYLVCRYEPAGNVIGNKVY